MVEFTRDDNENYNIKAIDDLSNIISVEPQECIINDNLFNADYYINLEVDEIGGNLSSNNSSLKNTFVRLKILKFMRIIGKYRVFNDSVKIFKPEKFFININKIKNSKGESLYLIENKMVLNLY